MTEVTINNKTYKVREAKTPEEREKGLQGVESLPEDEGMLFYFDSPLNCTFHMKNTPIALDIIFIDEDLEVISVKEGNPNSEEPITENNVLYVLEVNKGSDIKSGDILEFEEDLGPVMVVLAPDGSILQELWGGERIVSRKETKVLIRKAKRASMAKDDPDQFIRYCKALGKYMFKVLKGQDNRDPEYVSKPN